MANTIIIGIDPGSRCTGYGIIQQCNNRLLHIASGTIRCQQTQLGERLVTIYKQINDIIQHYQPTSAAIEQVFTSVNIQAALKLGQARGAALVALASHCLDVSEYSPRQIKQAVVGYGAAQKTQVQHMVRTLLNLQHTPPNDAADALAIAICHTQRQHYNNKLSQALMGAQS